MYIPPAFAETRTEVLASLMEAHSFALLVTVLEGKPFATHLPVLLDRGRGPRGTLRGHLAVSNPHAAAIAQGSEALIIFQGPHAYVSPRYYPSRANVPTWNYEAVHAYGWLAASTRDQLVRLLADTSEGYERGAEAPWTMDELRPGQLDGLVKGIVGFELEIERLEGKLKLSQNRTPEDRAGVVAGLEREGSPLAREVASEMRRCT
jgi:transcriptional regulator